ncbi:MULTISPECIES: helix-turn-helix domain-containing protein [unclassified Arthrobacter]|uniref:helix-turn-helix domain-containing protein n=1 Tax=unclassified Arthrobacter TaxID=235627 RepID=UPI001491EAE4|nr:MULTISPECIES: helix-turn-helix domain-containing protein [unclassified Arthrobacter]NOJ63367.1 helix-turn-helix domain-containing protein [Arthrobacter sp. 147(2020)]
MASKLAYTLEEAAQACGCSVRTIDQQVSDGILTARYVCEERIILHHDLEDWLLKLPKTLEIGHRGGTTIGTSRETSVAGKVFRTPEDVAPELGLKATTLRRLCRETEICTRLERNRITLTQEDVEAIRDHLRLRAAAAGEAEGLDHFATDPS